MSPLPVHPSSSADLAFVAPGLIHQFGNLLLTIQGQTLTLTPETQVRGRTAILGACDRGGTSLRLLRHLVGDAGAERAPVGQVVVALAELLRVPVREAGHMLACDEGNARHGAAVDLAHFVPLAVAMVRQLVLAVPTGVQGTLSLACSPPRLVQVGFTAAAGGLPFPLGLQPALATLQTLARRHGLDGALVAERDGFALHAMAAGLSGASAQA